MYQEMRIVKRKVLDSFGISSLGLRIGKSQNGKVLCPDCSLLDGSQAELV